MPTLILNEIKGMLPAEAIPLLDEYINLHPESDSAYTIRGMKHWALGHRALAIKDYHAALAINPHSDAGSALKVANDILDFYNKDLLNP
ncbi:MAG: hypothetical protein K2J82_03660 [Muribaculaceae bacterium]|nr:hypothetical protein [Muribaculaceae bacterium]MDE6753690.1 hypothetical protein [Muribaculaceae bacterium]